MDGRDWHGRDVAHGRGLSPESGLCHGSYRRRQAAPAFPSRPSVAMTRRAMERMRAALSPLAGSAGPLDQRLRARVRQVHSAVAVVALLIMLARIAGAVLRRRIVLGATGTV